MNQTHALLTPSWYAVPSWGGVPRWTWALMVAFALIEMLLARSKDPRYRSIADTIRHGLAFVLVLVPGAGPLLVRLLQAIYVVPQNPGEPPAALRRAVAPPPMPGAYPAVRDDEETPQPPTPPPVR